MKNLKRMIWLTVGVGICWVGCSPHFHLDVLGEEKLQEKVLVDSRAKEKILVMDVSGVIENRRDSTWFRREGDLLSRVYYRLDRAAKDPLVRGVILRLDTPGGEVTASDILCHEILAFKEKTGIPTAALLMGTATSGGYYVAAACDFIVAHPSTVTGSIGVVSIFPDTQELLAKLGIKVNLVKSGEMKDAGSVFREMKGEEREIFQGMVDEMYRRFLDVVYRSRKHLIPYEKLEELADGRIYTARQALAHKLVDEIGYFDTVLKRILEKASLEEAKVVAYTYYPSRKTNIYARTPVDNDPLKGERWYEKIFPTLESGFYYLWLPRFQR